MVLHGEVVFMYVTDFAIFYVFVVAMCYPKLYAGYDYSCFKDFK